MLNLTFWPLWIRPLHDCVQTAAEKKQPRLSCRGFCLVPTDASSPLTLVNGSIVAGADLSLQKEDCMSNPASQVCPLYTLCWGLSCALANSETELRLLSHVVSSSIGSFFLMQKWHIWKEGGDFRWSNNASSLFCVFEKRKRSLLPSIEAAMLQEKYNEQTWRLSWKESCIT